MTSQLTSKMVRLPLHRSNTSVHEEKPARHFYSLPRSLFVAQLVLGIISVDQILHDTPTFKNTNHFPVRESVGKSRDAAIGIDIQEPLFLLRVLGDVDFGMFVRQTTDTESVLTFQPEPVLTIRRKESQG